MKTIIKDCRLIDGNGGAPLENAGVIVEDGTITGAGPLAGLEWSPEDQIIEAGGRTLLPGFIDVHSHAIAYEYDLETRITRPMSLTVVKTLQNMKTMLDSGITTLRDGGGVDLGLKTAQAQGLVPGPRLFICIVPMSQTGGLFDLNMGSGANLDLTKLYGATRIFVNGVENLRILSRKLLLAGADLLKVCSTGSVFRGTPGTPPGAQYTVEEMAAVVYEAKAAGKHTMTHCEGGQGLINALDAGIDTIEHGFYLTQADVERMATQGSYLVPTLNCNYGILKISESNPDSGIHEQSIGVARQIIDDHRESIGRAYKAGVKIAMGADSFGWDQGDSLHELKLLVEAGLSPMEAITAGTRTGAELLGQADRFGTVEPGKLADLLIVDGDPLEDISLLRNRDNLRLIMQEGAVYKNTLEG